MSFTVSFRIFALTIMGAFLAVHQAAAENHTLEDCTLLGGYYWEDEETGQRGCDPPRNGTNNGSTNEGTQEGTGNTMYASDGAFGDQTVVSGSGAQRDPRVDSYGDLVNQLEQDYENECAPKKEKAGICCGQPERCIGEKIGIGETAGAMGYAFLQMLGGASATSASISQNCKQMQTVSYATAAINAAMSGTCSSYVNRCQSACRDIKQRGMDLKGQIPPVEQTIFGYDTHNHAFQSANPEYQRAQEFRAMANRIYNDANRAITECSTADNASVRNAMQAVAAAQAGKLAGLCKDKTEAPGEEDPGLDTIASNDFNVDCGAPGAAANPICQQQCSRPGAENDPVCRAYFANLNGGPGFGSGFGNSGINNLSGDGLSFDVGDPLDTDQFADPGQFDAQSQGLATATGTGGGGPGGGGSPGGGGGDFGAGGAGGMLDFNSKILRGLSGGQGYSNKVGGRTSGGGGFSGYGGGRKPAGKGKPFNLREFLPGGKKAAPRGLAALGSGHPEIGAKSDDIFKRISNRFYAICMQDRLYDCDTLRKMKRPQ